MLLSTKIKKVLFVSAGVFTLTPLVNPPLALLLGILVAFFMGSIFDEDSVQNLTSHLLKISVVGLGFGINFFESLEIGKVGLILTLVSIVTTFGLGYLLARKLSIDSKTSILISSGTAICGGSAIAAMSPIINASDRQVSIALGAVFILNAIALFLFPFIGDLVLLTETQFGYWAAIAIHDTSSVVGAGAIYGSKALSVATTVKLGRALWILPLTFIASVLSKRNNKSLRTPYFILLFVGAMVLNTFVPSIEGMSDVIVPVAKKILTLTLFLIGSGLSISTIRSIGLYPFLKATILWILISLSTLVVTKYYI